MSYSTSNSSYGSYYYNNYSNKSTSPITGSYSSPLSQNAISNYSNKYTSNSNQPRGLQNLTNTCYISAILQVLFPIINQKDFPISNKNRQKITIHFFQLKETKSTKDYRQLKQILQNKIQIVKGWEQQDAHQLLIHFFQEFGKQNSLPLKAGKVLNLSYDQTQNFQTNWERFSNEMLKIQNSKIINMFSGEILKQFKCRSGHEKHILQRFNNLSLPFPEKSIFTVYNDSVKLQDMLAKYFGQEDIDDLYCEKCKVKKQFIKSSLVYSPPKYLILHLSRFINGYYQSEKIQSEVQFDNTLYLANVREQRSTYKLIGIVHHTGSLNRGHYYADVLIQGEWFEMNDEKVYKQTIRQKSNISSSVYLLVYQKK